MAAVPVFGELLDVATVPPKPAGLDLEAGIAPSARRSFAAVAGVAAGRLVTYSDVQALAVYLGGGAITTYNRGLRGMKRTNHDAGSGGRPGGLWRF